MKWPQGTALSHPIASMSVLLLHLILYLRCSSADGRKVLVMAHPYLHVPCPVTSPDGCPTHFPTSQRTADMKDIGVKIHTYLAGWEPCLQTGMVSGKALCVCV